MYNNNLLEIKSEVIKIVLNEETIDNFLKLESFTDKENRIVFRTTSLNFFAMKSVALNIEKIFEEKRISRAKIVRLATFSLFKSFDIKSFDIKSFDKYKEQIKASKKANDKHFCMYLDDQACRKIDKLIKKERAKGKIVSRNEILNTACAMLNDNWLEVKEKMNEK